MPASDVFVEDFDGGTPGARGEIIVRFDDTAGLYAATRFSYSELERAVIIRCLETAIGATLVPHQEKLFFFKLGSIGIWGLNTVLQLPELEAERNLKAAQIELLRGATGVCAAMHEDPNLAVALPLLLVAMDELNERVVNLRQRIDHITSRYPGAGNNRWFAQIVQAHLAEALEDQGGEVSGSKAFLAYHDAIMKPLLENPAVWRITGCLWTEGMGRTFAAKYRGGEGRRK